MDAQLQTLFMQWLSTQTHDSLQQACSRYPELLYGVNEVKAVNPALIPAPPKQALLEQAKLSYRNAKRRGVKIRG